MDNKNSTTEIEAVFFDIRKAYRLLYTYQSRVMEIMHFIGNMTSRRYEGGWSKFSNSSPKNGKGNLDLWAWDWLNMYCYEFYFGIKEINENSIKFSVWLVSDTGFYDIETADETDIESFSSVESSKTKLVFVIGKNTWHTNFKDFQSNMKNDATDYVRRNENEVLLAKSFNLSSFINSDQTRERIQEFVSFCNSNGISEFTILK